MSGLLTATEILDKLGPIRKGGDEDFITPWKNQVGEFKVIDDNEDLWWDLYSLEL